MLNNDCTHYEKMIIKDLLGNKTVLHVLCPSPSYVAENVCFLHLFDRAYSSVPEHDSDGWSTAYGISCCRHKRCRLDI